MKETQFSLNAIVLNYVRGYFKNLFLSWSIFWGFFMIFLCLVMIPWFIFQLIDILIAGFYNGISRFLYNLNISRIIYPYLQNYPETLNKSVSLFLFIVLPLIVLITKYIFKSNYEKLEHKFVKKFFLITAPITSITLCLSFIMSSLKSDYPWSDSIFSIIFFFIVFSVGSLFAYGFYRISEYLENLKFQNGKWVYSDD